MKRKISGDKESTLSDQVGDTLDSLGQESFNWYNAVETFSKTIHLGFCCGLVLSLFWGFGAFWASGVVPNGEQEKQWKN